MNKEITVQEIQSKIIKLPGRPPAMLDRDLAEIYGTASKRVNEAAKRNPRRFPHDFRFQLTKEETETLRSQNATFQWLQGVKYLPWGYAREGCNMMSAWTPPGGQMSFEQLETALKCYKVSLEILELLLSLKKSVARPVANDMTRDIVGVDLMDFIYPYLFSAPKNPEVFSFPVEDGDEEDALIFFVIEWRQRYGEKPVSSRELCGMIDDEGVPMDLGTGGGHSRKIRLGKMLAKLAGREIGDHRIVDAGKRKGVRVWRLENI